MFGIRRQAMVAAVAFRFQMEETTMGSFDDAVKNAVPGGNLATPIAVAVGAFVPRVSIFRDGLDISLSVIGVMGWLAISAALSVASSVVPAIAAARRCIREGLSYE